MMGDLVFQVFSVDQSGNFVFGAEARGNASFRNDFIYWSTQGNNDTMLGIHNVSDEDLPVVVTIGFNDGKSSYRFAPVTIPRGATTGLDLKQMIAQSTKPDDKGNPIPQNATFGTLRIETADGQLVERFLATASIYDPVSGTCGNGCKICNVADQLQLLNNPLAGAVSTTQQVTATVQWDDGSSSDATLQSSFLSSASSVISVTNTRGTSGNGMATFSTVGTATITGIFSFTGGDPGEPPPECPTACPTGIIQGKTPGTTQVPTSLRFISVTVLPDGTTGAFGCPANSSGIRVDNKYQVLDQNNQPIQSSNMIPHEKGNLFSGSPYDNNIGPVPNYPTSGQFTASDGSFHDVPFGACLPGGTFSSLSATQNITIIIGTVSYPVRSHDLVRDRRYDRTRHDQEFDQ